MNLKSIYDLTLPISPSTLTYPGDPKPIIRRVQSIDETSRLNVSEFVLNCHVGTHVDAPLHFLSNGPSLGTYPISAFVGPAQVIDIDPNIDIIRPEHLESQMISRDQHLLLRTKNADLIEASDFSDAYTYLSPESAEYLATLEPRSIGFDYYSVDGPESSDFPAHLAFARHGLLVFVCLRLQTVSPGHYFFSGLPLRLENVEAAPVRALLMPPTPSGVSRALPREPSPKSDASR